VRNLKHFREADFISDLQYMLWHEIESTKDPNLAWKKWESSFNEVLNRHAPLIHKRIRSSSLPWLNSTIKIQMYTRDYHKKQFVKHIGHNITGSIIKLPEIKLPLKCGKVNQIIFNKKLRIMKRLIPKRPGN
jgi:hypothetical protein